MKKRILIVLAALPIVIVGASFSFASDRITASDSQTTSTEQTSQPAQSKSSVQGVTRGNIRRRFNGIYTPPRAATVRNWVRRATTGSPIRLRVRLWGRQRRTSASGTNPNLQVPNRQVR